MKNLLSFFLSFSFLLSACSNDEPDRTGAYINAKALVRTGNLSRAYQVLDTAGLCSGAPYDSAYLLHEDLKKRLYPSSSVPNGYVVAVRTKAEKSSAKAAQPIEKRVLAGAAMRELYLDNGQDVEVRVTGKKKDVITLSYALIGAVWSHRMQTDSTVDQLFDLGFNRIILTNGYDYNHVLTHKN